MKLIVILALVAVAASAELDVIKIVRQSMDMDETGRYSHEFETENGIKVEESGVNKQIDENAGMTMRGSYSFTEAGVTYTVNWIADENGFQPSGAHLPVAPSV